MHAKLACLGYLCHHGPQKWTLPILIELFSAHLNFRTEPADFILPVVAHVGVTEGKRWGSWNGGKTERKEPSAEQRVWCMKKMPHIVRTHACGVFFLRCRCSVQLQPCHACQGPESFPPSGEEPSKHMENITAGWGGGCLDLMGGGDKEDRMLEKA